MPIKRLHPRKPTSNPSAKSPSQAPFTPSHNSQLAIRPDANQHLRVAAHSRLQNRQRAIAHLPVFLFPASALRITNTLLRREKHNIPAEQSHTLCAGHLDVSISAQRGGWWRANSRALVARLLEEGSARWLAGLA